MKRGADKQLTQDDPESQGDDNSQFEDDEQQSREFKRADQSALASRPIRGMPKRLQNSQQSQSQPQPQPQSQQPVKSNPFASAFSNNNSNNTQANKSPFSGFSFGSIRPTSTTSSTTSSTSNSDANISLGNGNSNTTTSNNDNNDQSYINYYASLKGLNHSLIDALKSAFDKDPFIDLTNALISANEDYKKHLKSINDKKSEQQSQQTTQQQKPVMPSAPPSVPSMPSVGGFKLQPSSQPPSNQQSSGFKFNPTQSNSNSQPKSLFSFGSATKSDNQNLFSSFNNNTNNKNKSENVEQPTTVNRFSALNKENDDKDDVKRKEDDMVIPPAPKPASAIPIKTTNVPSLFNGSQAPSTPSSSTSTNNKNNEHKSQIETPKPITDLSDQNNPFATKKPVEFGAALSEKKSPFQQTSPGFTFGQSATSNSDSPLKSSSGFSFSFGSGASNLPAFPNSKEMDNAPKNPFTISTNSNKGEEDKNESKDEENKKNESEEPKSEEVKPSSSSTSDVTAAGEEDEDILYEVRAKAFKFLSNRDDQPTWKSVGVGPFKIKINKLTNKKRILHRDSSTSKLIMNFNLHSEMNPTVDNKTITFTGIEVTDNNENPLSVFKLMVKTPQSANETCNAIIEHIKDI